MRLSAFLLAIITLLTAVAEGRLSWNSTLCDLGEILESDGKVACMFKAVNVGDSPVVILRARPSCGCLVSDYPRAAINPGDTAVVNAIFNPTGRIGEFVNFITVTTDASPHRTELKITGKVKGMEMTVNEQYPVAAGSLKLNAGSIPFGCVVEGSKARATIEAYNDSDVPVKYYVKNAPRWVKISPGKATVKPHSVQIIQVEMNTGKCGERGYVEGAFSLLAEPVKHTTGALAGIKKIDVMAVVQDDFAAWSADEMKNAPAMQVAADRMVFADMVSDFPVTKKLTITNRGNDELKIYGVRPAEECIEVKILKKSIAKGDTSDIEITVYPDKVKDNILNTSIIIYCNDPYSSSRMVRIVGNLKL